MKETNAIIERIRRVNTDFQRLELSVDETLLKIKPGQSMMARLTESWNPYLRQQWWPVNLSRGKLVVERPANEMYEPGQVVPVLGLVGQPFRFRGTGALRNVLLIAYDTPPTPLLMTIPWLLGNKISVTLVLVGSAVSYDTQHLPPEVEIELGDIPQLPADTKNPQPSTPSDADFSWRNQIMTLGWADQVFVTVGPDDELNRFSKVLG
ncbi:MAG: hypothetical protein H7Y11_00355, partial [Armatimonadetes bacterium]|nr:hypothetical protein [Anaerolineae bacterium]